MNKNFESRIKTLEANQVRGEIIYGVYKFSPKERTVYREVGQYSDMVKVYMDYDEVMAQDFTLFHTIVGCPNYDNPNWKEESDGLWSVAVGGTSVINENN